VGARNCVMVGRIRSYWFVTKCKCLGFRAIIYLVSLDKAAVGATINRQDINVNEKESLAFGWEVFGHQALYISM